VVIQQPTVEVSVNDESVSVFQYTGSPVYPPINAESPITYNGSTFTVGLNESDVYISAGQVSGLGTSAIRNVAVSGDASANEVVLGNDSRLASSSSHMPFGIVTDVSGQYLVSMGSGVVNQILPTYRPLFVPMFMSDSAHVDRIAIEVASSASENGVVRLGIYESNERGLPGNLIVDAGTVNGSIVGVKQAIINETLTGLVWLCVVGQNSNVSVKSFTNTIQAYPSPTTGAVSAGKLALSFNAYYYGVLPSFAGASPVGITYYPPLVNLRLA
jgi:hypothetical protein